MYASTTKRERSLSLRFSLQTMNPAETLFEFRYRHSSWSFEETELVLNMKNEKY